MGPAGTVDLRAESPVSRAGRRRLALVLFVAFILVPLAELYVLIQVGGLIGIWPTIALLIVDSVIGAWLMKREGGRAWQALRARLDAGRMPGRELADGVLVVIGAALMLSPGFVTDALGLLLVVPVTRPFFRRLLTAYAAQRASVAVVGHSFPGAPVDPQRQGRSQTTNPGPAAGDAVVRGEVLDED